ncbi:MAG: hypothetical protein WCK05_03210 [Planctomycetota bacterium]|jgi:hypothetical protein
MTDIERTIKRIPLLALRQSWPYQFAGTVVYSLLCYRVTELFKKTVKAFPDDDYPAFHSRIHGNLKRLRSKVKAEADKQENGAAT